MHDHTPWMRLALQEAEKALTRREVPVGAVVVQEGRIVGRGHNLMETLQDPTAHAEMLAITAAANTLASWRLEDAILYVTLEPCMMCTGAALLARVPLIVYGAGDPRYGACGSAMDLTDGRRIDIGAEVVGGVLEAECSALLKAFFKSIRQRRRPE
jgi:tRNA(adenine34) deaminase